MAIMNYQVRRQLDFWLLAGVIGLWVYWFFLFRTGLLDMNAFRFYLWLLWRNLLPVSLFALALFIFLFCFRKGKKVIAILVLIFTAIFGYWAYGPDFPKHLPIEPPKAFWEWLTPSIPIVLVISYAYREEIPPLPFLRVQEWLYRNKVQVKEEEFDSIFKKVQEDLVELAKKAGEDAEIFEKCLKIAINYISADTSIPCLPLFAEKRYEHVTGQLCWVFGFVKFQISSEDEPRMLVPRQSFEPWVAVRLRFPQKAWLTYLAIEPEHALRNLFLTLVVIVGYVVFLKVLRYAFDKWF